MKILADFKAALSKGSATSIALGVALGMTVKDFAERIFDLLVVPLLRFITGGAEKGLLSGTLDWTYFKLGSLLLTIIGFAVIIAIIYAVFCIVIPMLFGKSSDDSTPPPPAPPIA
jgi:large-conductance mechanosensitive channel